MSEVVVSHGTYVAPEALWAAVAALDRSEHELGLARRAAGFGHGWQLAGAIDHLGGLRDGLEQAIINYTRAERDAENRLRTLSSGVAWLSGFAARFGFGQPGLLAFALIAGLYGGGKRDWAVRLLRQGIEATDDAVWGNLGVLRLGQRTDAPADVALVLLSLLGLAGPDQALSVRRTGQLRTVAPRSVSELAARIPRGADQIRIERFGTADAPRWVVYVAGTASGALGGSEPFDMKSNVKGVAGQVPASELAVIEAMRSAGVQPSDPVMIVGHSQGGLIANDVASSGQFQVTECVTFGAPLGTSNSTVPTLALEHRQDPVPALAGVSEPCAARTVWLADTPDAQNTAALAAHRISEYERTARMVDRSMDPELQAVRARIRDFTAGSGTASNWRAERVG